MNNDLISRSALKKAICTDEPISIGETWEQLYDAVVKAIDNAPTVEPFEPDYVGAERLKARQRGYEEGYRNGMEIGKTLNPKIKQGEWIEGKNGNVKCNRCGCEIRYSYLIGNKSDFPKFCCDCGADMGSKS